MAALFFCLGEVASASVPRVSRFAAFEGAKVHYSSHGEGPVAFVLVHGWNCDESVWTRQILALTEKARVLTVDLLGHGESDRPSVNYTMDRQAEALDAVLRDAGVTAAILVGHSNGTPVIRQFLRRFPAKVRALVIVDGALRPFGDAAMMERFIAPLRGPEYAATVRRFVDGMTEPMKDEHARAQVRAMMQRGAQNVAVSEMESMQEADLWKPDRIEVPVLMLMAKQPAWTAEYEEFAHSLCPNLDYRVWSGVSHFLMIDEPQKFNDALLEFAAKHDLLRK